MEIVDCRGPQNNADWCIPFGWRYWKRNGEQRVKKKTDGCSLEKELGAQRVNPYVLLATFRWNEPSAVFETIAVAMPAS